MNSDHSCDLILMLIIFIIFTFVFQAKNPPSLTPAHTPNDPFNDDERERLQVEALAKKFENKYVSFLFCFLISAFEVFLI